MVAPRHARQQRRAPLPMALILVFTLGMPWAGAAEDPLDSSAADWRATDWRAAAWPALTAEEQHWFLVGVSLGWRGLAAADHAFEAPEPEATAAWRARLAGLAEAALESRLAVLLLRQQEAAPLPAFAVTGATWLALETRPRLALLHGLYAGSYGAAIAGLEPERGTDRLEAAFARARRLVAPPLALAPPLAYARLSDWLFYSNHRPVPLVETIKLLAEQIRGS